MTTNTTTHASGAVSADAPTPFIELPEHSTDSTTGHVEVADHGTYFTVSVTESGPSGTQAVLEVSPQALADLAAWITRRTF